MFQFCCYYTKSCQCTQGRPSPPETMMHFPPCFRFPPYFRKIFGLSEFFYNFTFSLKILYFLPPNFLMTFFLVINHKFRIFPPYFRCFSTFPPCFAKIILSPLLLQIFPPVLGKFTCFLRTLRDAFMHHPMHVLDAPE